MTDHLADCRKRLLDIWADTRVKTFDDLIDALAKAWAEDRRLAFKGRMLEYLEQHRLQLTCNDAGYMISDKDDEVIAEQFDSAEEAIFHVYSENLPGTSDRTAAVRLPMASRPGGES